MSSATDPNNGLVDSAYGLALSKAQPLRLARAAKKVTAAEVSEHAGQVVVRAELNGSLALWAWQRGTGAWSDPRRR